MIALLLTCGAQIDASTISHVIKKISPTGSLDHLISSIKLDPDDSSKFTCDKSLIEQCRMVTSSLVSESDPIDYLRIVLVSTSSIDDSDGLAVISMFHYVSGRATRKSLTLLTVNDGLKVQDELLACCLAKAYKIEEVIPCAISFS